MLSLFFLLSFLRRQKEVIDDFDQKKVGDEEKELRRAA